MRPPLALLSVVLSLLSTLSVAADPVVRFEERAVVATGFTPGAATAWFAVSNDATPYSTRIHHGALLLSADAAGSIRLDRPNAIPTTSMWVAIDLESGAYAIAAPAGYKIQSSTLPTAALRARAPGVDAKLQLEADEHELFYVRPRVGAWRLAGESTLTLRDMAPVGDSPSAPENFQSGDLIVVVKPFSMLLRTLRVR